MVPVRCTCEGVRCTCEGVRCTCEGVRCTCEGVRCTCEGVRCTCEGWMCTSEGVRCTREGEVYQLVRCTCVRLYLVEIAIKTHNYPSQLSDSEDQGREGSVGALCRSCKYTIITSTTITPSPSPPPPSPPLPSHHHHLQTPPHNTIIHHLHIPFFFSSL